MSGRSGTPTSMDVTLADIEASARNAQPGERYGKPLDVNLDTDCTDPTCCPDPDPDGAA